MHSAASWCQDRDKAEVEEVAISKQSVDQGGAQIIPIWVLLVTISYQEKGNALGFPLELKNKDRAEDILHQKHL